MQKGDAAAPGPETRGVIDEAVAGGTTPCQRRVEIRDAIADVVDPRPAPGEKRGDGTRGVDGLEQLDGHVAERQADDARAVRGLGAARGEPEDVAIEGQGLGEARDGNADVVHSGLGHTTVNLTIVREGVEGYGGDCTSRD